MTLSDDDWIQLVAGAYQSLYDLVQLRTHPLASLLFSETHASPKERGWQLHKELLHLVEELNPGGGAPPFSREWRRYRLMAMRYVDGADPQHIADHLAISRRQYYREHQAAVEAAAALLRNRLPVQPPVTGYEQPDNLLQIEVTRLNQQEHIAYPGEIVAGVLALLDQLSTAAGVTIHNAIPTDRRTAVLISRNVLRQVMLGVLSTLLATSHDTSLSLSCQSQSQHIHMTIAFETPVMASEPEIYDQLEPYNNMLQFGGGMITPIFIDAGMLHGVQLQMPADTRNTILVIDDNRDMLELYERYLTSTSFQVYYADKASTALDLARDIKPGVVILDLMMPETDGWEIMKALRAEDGLQDTVIAICSVLRHRELALALGANYFLQKPISEITLLTAIAELRRA
jgi:CheY-like chemotaxis protein